MTEWALTRSRVWLRGLLRQLEPIHKRKNWNIAFLTKCNGDEYVGKMESEALSKSLKKWCLNIFPLLNLLYNKIITVNSKQYISALIKCYVADIYLFLKGYKTRKRRKKKIQEFTCFPGKVTHRQIRVGHWISLFANSKHMWSHSQIYSLVCSLFLGWPILAFASS